MSPKIAKVEDAETEPCVYQSGRYEVEQSSEGVRVIIGTTEQKMQERVNGRAVGQYRTSNNCISHSLSILQYYGKQSHKLTETTC